MMYYLSMFYKQILGCLLLVGTISAQDFFKFSTIYGAYSFSSPITKELQYQVSGGQLQELQQELQLEQGRFCKRIIVRLSDPPTQPNTRRVTSRQQLDNFL